MSHPIPLRSACPPGACICGHDALLADPGADRRILRLTREEEKRLLLRLQAISSLDDLERMRQRMFEQLGIQLTIAPGSTQVRTLRGIRIDVHPMPGLCRKTRQAISTAIRRGLEQTPAIAYALLDAHGLFGMD